MNKLWDGYNGPTDDPQAHAMREVAQAYGRGEECDTNDLAELADYLKSEVMDRDFSRPAMRALMSEPSFRPF